LKLCEDFKDEDDELMLILAYSYFYLGKSAALSGSLKSGVAFLENALIYSKKTIYDTSKIECAAPLYSAVCKNIQSPLLEFDAEEFTAAFSDNVELEFYHYLTMNAAYDYKNRVYSSHLFAKGLISKRDYERALPELIPLIDEIRRCGYNAFVMLGVYTDIENCYRQIGDYENAYRYARKRMSLGEGFNS
jgi:tetratricopeptide (TPR) repeat protein